MEYYCKLSRDVDFSTQSAALQCCWRFRPKVDAQPPAADEQAEASCCRICLLEIDNDNTTSSTSSTSTSSTSTSSTSTSNSNGSSSSSMKLDCSCKGDMALAHTDCVIKWFSIRDNNKCDVCHRLVTNLPPLLPSSKQRDSQRIDWELPEDDDDDETDYYYPIGLTRRSSWQGLVAEIASCVLARIWFKLEELAELP